MDVTDAFEQLRTAFPQVAQFQGTHFKFAERNGVWVIERKRAERFFYWLMWEGKAKLVHASAVSKFSPLKTVGDSFTPSAVQS